jgi:hypothetical protein
METITLSLRGRADEIDELVKQARRGSLPDALRFWKLISDQYDELDKQRKRVYQAIEDMSRKTIPEMMEEQGIKTITLEDIGYRFTVAQRYSCSMPDKEAGMAWLKANGLGDLIQPTVNAQTLSSAAKKRLEDDGLEMPTDLFNTSWMAYTSATKAR